jgi:hypothetical protein
MALRASALLIDKLAGLLGRHGLDEIRSLLEPLLECPVPQYSAQ